MVSLRRAPLHAAALVCAGALWVAPAMGAEADSAAPAVPARIAVIPFQCVRPCDQMPRLQSLLVDRLVDKGTFELLVTTDMQDPLLSRPSLRTARDTLAARAARGEQPDSAAAALLARRFGVSGFLYGTMTYLGPRVAVWALTPRARDVFQYRPGRSSGVQLPPGTHEGAQDRAAQFNTGGAAPGGGAGSPSGSTSGGGKSTGEPTAQLPNQFTKDPVIMGSTQSDDERFDNIAEEVTKGLQKLLHPQGKARHDE